MNFYPAICNTRVISVRYQQRFCFLVRKRLYRCGFLRIETVILGVRQWNKGCETLPHTSTFVGYFVFLKM
jgi:hypothetical protein